jgi:hypothetical protein
MINNDTKQKPCYGRFIKVEDVKQPLTRGEYYLVPCIVREQDEKLYITPVINHPHNDKENGQNETHYHVDYRFVKHKADGNFPTVVNKHSKHYFVENERPQEGLHGKLEYFILPMLNEDFIGITPTSLISKSNLKHKCIYKGKCPHRGYDLSQVKPINGKITCPLHGIEFDSKTGLILNHLIIKGGII